MQKKKSILVLLLSIILLLISNRTFAEVKCDELLKDCKGIVSILDEQAKAYQEKDGLRLEEVKLCIKQRDDMASLAKDQAERCQKNSKCKSVWLPWTITTVTSAILLGFLLAHDFEL